MDAPGRLFAVLLQDQRWEVITQEDEDQARALLREHRDGPPRTSYARDLRTCTGGARCPTTHALCCGLQQVLRQAGWQGELFLGVKLVDPAWTRARWEQGEATLAQWQKQQGRARGQGSGLEALPPRWENEREEVDYT